MSIGAACHASGDLSAAEVAAYGAAPQRPVAAPPMVPLLITFVPGPRRSRPFKGGRSGGPLPLPKRPSMPKHRGGGGEGVSSVSLKGVIRSSLVGPATPPSVTPPSYLS